MTYQTVYEKTRDYLKRIAPYLQQAVVPGLSVLFTVLILMVLSMGRTDEILPDPSPVPNAKLVDQFDQYYSQELKKAQAGAITMKKHFWIEKDATQVPKPNPECYGETDDPSTLQWLIDKAKDLLEFEDLYFNTAVPIAPDTHITYYLDESIFVVSWKEVRDNYMYTFSEIKVSDPSQIRRHITSPYVLGKATQLSVNVNSVVASGGDFFRNRTAGINVYDGKVLKVASGEHLDTCYVDRNGDLHFTYRGEILTMEQAEAFVQEHDIDWSVCFGPVLIDNGVRCEHPAYMLGEVNQCFSRAAFGQRGKLHYMLVVANLESIFHSHPTIHSFAKNVENLGCEKMYTLDGGQTGCIIMNGNLISSLFQQYGAERNVSDIIYFATAVPNIEQ